LATGATGGLAVISRLSALQREEELRLLVRELPDDSRRAFFDEAERLLKDPDTYASLNYVFLGGLHHFYLGKWIRGLATIVVFWVGVALLFREPIAGLVAIFSVSVCEIYELFRSDTIVRDHNNNVMHRLYSKISGQ
jgi:hypothetical protein